LRNRKMMLSVKHISKAFDSSQDVILKDISLEVPPAAYFVLLGASAMGKSVVLEIIAGLTAADSGTIILDDSDITNEEIQKRSVGLVFQDNTLFPHMTVFDNIAYALRCHGPGKSQIRERVSKLATDVGVTELLKRKPPTLSGGEAQRVSLARALAAEPKLLLLDEPISSLDVKARAQIRALLRKINARGQTIIHVTHDYTEAVSLATHIAILEDGAIAQTGSVDEIFRRPKSEFVAEFVGIRNFFRGHLNDTDAQGPHSKSFTTDGLCFAVLTEEAAGPGYVMIRSEDVTIASTASPAGQTSARNNFEGAITDIIPAGPGVEIVVDIGKGKSVEIAAMITAESVKKLDLTYGIRVGINFKASAVKFIEQ